MSDDNTPIWGAKIFAKVIGRFKEDGTPNERAVFYLLESGALGDAVKKVGGRYVSTPRKLRAALGLGEVVS
jgi:hypothetical protein